MKSIIDRVASNEEFHRRLMEHPLEVAQSEGYAVSIEQIADLLHMDISTEQDIQYILSIHLSQLACGKWF